MEADLITRLMLKGSLQDVLINILIHLDDASLSCTAAVCRLWCDFMTTNIKQNTHFIKRRLQLHWREKIPEVKHCTLYTIQHIHYIV